MKHFSNKTALLKAVEKIVAMGKSCTWRECNKYDGVAGWLLFF